MLSPNQAYGRNGQTIKGFVIHITNGSFKSALAWCTDIKSQVSYHFIIDRGGEDIALVMPENTAWHAGLIRNATTELVRFGPNPNLYTIGIALAGVATAPPTVAQIAKCAKLINYLAPYYDIPLDRKHIIAHNEIRSDKICPGPFIDLPALIYLASLEQ
jgi:N-acetylmuramoyl-L-alanine amidase